MANPGFLNDNQFRDYPFQTRLDPLDQADYPSEPLPIQALPPSAVVDAGAIMYAGSRFGHAHQVYLYAVSREAGRLYYDLRTDAPGGSYTRCLFSRSIDSPLFETEWTVAEFLDGRETDSVACDDMPNWEAFLITGDVTPLTDLLSDGEAIIFPVGLWALEPARIQNLATYAQTINLANLPRSQAAPSSDCLDSDAIDPPTNPYGGAVCLTGQIIFKEGYNASIRQDANTNSLIIGATPGGGEGQPCEEVPLYAGEVSPDGGKFLSGGPGCNEVLTSINGVAGRNIVLRAGPGFRIYPDPDQPHTLVVDRNLQDLAACDAGGGGSA